MVDIKIREYTAADARALADIYYNTIHRINIRDYSEEQVNVWAPATSLELPGWQKKWAKLSPLVAVAGEKVVGFAEFEPNGHIDCFYGHHEWQGKGVGSALMHAIVEKASMENITRIFAEVSITAKPFFEKKGFCVVKEQTIVRKDVELTNFVMEKVMIHIDRSLVRSLVATQFPEWADLPITPVEPGGWDNRTFHLGKYMKVRLPSAEDYAPQAEKEYQWLPKLAPHLPCAIPQPLAIGAPGEGYPWRWSVYGWLEGEPASEERIADMCQFATALAGFLVALQGCDATFGPMAGQHNFYRGGSLATYDAETREAIATLTEEIDAEAVTSVWDAALASTWQAPPVWVHGDVAISNLLTGNGRLSSIIDFGSMGIGDPACDLAIAWTFFTGESRNAFRAALKLDSATWARGRGWTLWKALCASLPGTSRTEVKRVIDEVLADHKEEGV